MNSGRASTRTDPSFAPNWGRAGVYAGTTVTGGYGIFWADGENVLAHRFAWKLSDGEIPDGLDVLHHCDNPPCVRRKDHLFLGTDADNTADKMAKGRQARGETHPRVIMTDAIVTDARQRAAAGANISTMARELGVSVQAMGHAVSGLSWKHLVQPPVKLGTPPGERNPNARLTAAIVVEARRRAALGEAVAALAREFGVSTSGMAKAISGRLWGHIPIIQKQPSA